MLHQVIPLVQEIIENTSIKLNLSLKASNLLIYVDTTQIEQVLINIIKNAKEALVETENPEDTIQGIVYDVTTNDLRQADLYEGKHYKRVEVVLQSNQKAWAYSLVV